MSEADHHPETEIRAEYDFRGGVRGKYADRFPPGCKVVVRVRPSIDTKQSRE